MITNKFKLLLLLLPASLLFHACEKENIALPDESYVAFSLRQAQALLRQNNAPEDSSLHQLGGITRLVGWVLDRENNDIILVGKKSSQLPPARFDDLAVALRSRFVHDDLPMVSIDPPADAASENQKVVFGGGIENTPFGMDFLQADVLLKRYSLDIEKQIREVSSYKKLLLDYEIEQLRQQGIVILDTQSIDPQSLGSFEGKSMAEQTSRQSRFWFNYKDLYKVRTDGEVFCIMSADLVIEKELTAGSPLEIPGGTTAPDDQFAALFTANYYQLCQTYPVLHRLKMLFDLAALAEGLNEAKGGIPDLDYLLNKYPVSKTVTPTEYPLLKKCTAIGRADGKTNLVQLSGGIEPSVEIEFLNGGNVSYLKQFVLQSRPAKNALFWRLPLDQWKMPNATGMVVKKPAGKTKSGCNVNVSNCIIFNQPPAAGKSAGTFNGFARPQAIDPIQTKGVKMTMQIDTSSFQRDTTLKAEDWRKK